MKITTKQIHQVAYFDLDDFVSLTYGMPFESVSIEEWDNDSSHTFSGIGSGPLSKYESRVLDEIKTSGEFPNGCLRPILHDLCLRGLIPPGDYIINASW